MSISGVPAAGAGLGAGRVDGDGRGQMKQVLSAVAGKLGMSTDDLAAALKSGKSLADVATAKGLSRDDLIATIKASLTSAGASQTDAAATTMANRIADHKGGHHHHHHAAGSAASAPPAPSTAPSGPGVGTIVDQLA